MSLTTSEQRSGRLPAELTSFIGRRDELAEIGRLFGQCRLVTLMGPGGVGKTRLAIRAANRLAASFEDGVCFVDLSGLRESSLLAQAVGEAFGLPDQAPAAALDALVHYLGERRMLLVLDTCEHLIDGCAMLAEVLLQNASGLRVLTTSRQPLDITGEYTLMVAPLAVPDEPAADAEPVPLAASCDSMTLFAERAAAVVSGWTITERNVGAVALLCHRLDGIPLAIELTAVQLRALSIEQVVARLDRRILRLRGRRTSMPRHQTLRAAIDWSHELCSPGERLLWARLSVFAGAFDLEDAEHICAGGELPAEEIVELLAGLVAQSIVLRVDADGAARYRMLDTLREYGAEMLELLGQDEAVRGRAFERFSGAIRRAAAELGTEAQPRWLEWFRREQANVRAAMEHGLRAAGDEDIARAFLGLGRILALQGLIGEARYWGTRVFASRDLTALRIRESAELLALFGLLAVVQDDLAQGRELVDQAEARARASGDDVRGLAYVREVQGVAALGLDRMEDAGRLLGEARDLHRLAGNDDVLAPLSDVFLAAAKALAGDIDGAVRDATEVVAAAEAAGELWCRSYGLCVRGLALVVAGDPERGLDDLRPALRIKLDLGDRLGVGLAFDVIGAALVALGEVEPAARVFGAGDAALRFTGVSLFGLKHRLLREAYWRRGEELIGEEAFRKAYDGGVALPFEAAVAEALGEPAAPEAPPVPAAPVAVPAPRNGDAPLTPRELEIAALVTEGLTNREIAGRLVIAKRTVDSHVEHILSKLAFTSRTQIAAWFSQRA
ncbi:LuxR C-terminal-related transcriptional regulator [Actinomadura rugatobispora]|uniref:LuxR C-terminal-related transcriptional regulator n=1 Tax=Actinomadura rugatobispora TaxID=1994 RepID=A0ABW1AB25_9ACTN|nr:LuxR family transcriptional regulator [Actinomadura rugatobispora]